MINRFDEVAELIDVCWLDIIATIDCRELSPNTTYTAYLIFDLTNRSVGLDSETQEASITIAVVVSARHTVSLYPGARSQRSRVGSISHYWEQQHRWKDEDSEDEDDEEMEEEDGDKLVEDDEDDDEIEDDEEEDDDDIDQEEYEKDDENEDNEEREKEDEDDDIEVEEDEDDENEENDSEEEEQYNLWLEEEESDDDDEEEEEENEFHLHSPLSIATARRIRETSPSSDLSGSLGDEQKHDVVRYPRVRDDGWMEVEMGVFYNGNLDDGAIEIRLKEHTSLNWKSGLILEGVEIRPNIECDKKAATS